MVATLHQLIGQLDEYFPKAQEFIPERWMKGDPQESKYATRAIIKRLEKIFLKIIK